MVADGVSDEEPTACDRGCLSHAGMVFLEIGKCVVVYEFVQDVAWEGSSTVTRGEN